MSLLTSSDDKVEKPLCGGTESDVEGTEACRGNLRDENPADGTPTELEETASHCQSVNPCFFFFLFPSFFFPDHPHSSGRKEREKEKGGGETYAAQR